MPTNTQDKELEPLIKDVKNNIRTRLGDLMSKLLNQADDTLFELAEGATSNEEQNRFFDLMRQLKDHKQAIAVEFIENIDPYLRPYGIVEEEKSNQKQELEGELSLVEKSDVEDMVLVKNIGEKAAGKYREQLSHLEARLEHLALKTDDIFTRDALMPVNFCQAFDDALADKFNIDNKKLLFQIFNEEIASKLDALYDSINNRFIDAGILPQIKLFTHNQSPKRRRSDSAMQDMSGEVPPMDEPESYGNYAMTAPPGASFGHRGGAPGISGTHAPGAGGAGNPGAAMPGAPMGGTGGVAGAPMGGAGGIPGAPGTAGTGGAGLGAPGGGAAGHHGQGGGAAGAAPGVAGEPGAPGMPGGGSPGGAAGNAEAGSGEMAGIPASGSGGYSHYTAGMPANQVGQVLGQFFGVPIARGDAPEESDAAQTFAEYTASTPQYYGHEEILTALSQVQATPQFEQPEEIRFDADVIKQALLDEISKKSGGMVTKRINQIAEKTIDFIELIFDAIIDDGEISDTIKALLLRLQIPVIKASMVDQEFFIYDDHPARVLLDKIADVGVGVTEHTDDIYIRLDRIVTDLVTEYDLQTSTFQAALDSLNEFIEELEREAARIEQEAQRQVLREHARTIVLKSLRGVTAGMVLPEAVHPLVLKRWPTLMFNHYLEHGKENDEWINIIDVLREIISSVQSIDTPEDLAHLKSTQDDLVASVRDKLSRTNQSESDIEGVVQGLIDTHQNIIGSCAFSDQQMEDAEEAITEEDWTPSNTIEPAAEPEAPKAQLPSNIMPGMWFRVNMGEDSVARRCKLSVIIVEDSRLVFVNHAGEIVVEKGFDEFTEEMSDGLSSVIMGHSVFDHALNSVITKLSPSE